MANTISEEIARFARGYFILEMWYKVRTKWYDLEIEFSNNSKVRKHKVRDF